ncbi:hypothetical protein E4U54_004791 [Claviceps lovelessii]|nr:hypothetical protein E4U54_004791 [Claviceps lovelessii]
MTRGSGRVAGRVSGRRGLAGDGKWVAENGPVSDGAAAAVDSLDDKFGDNLVSSWVTNYNLATNFGHPGALGAVRTPGLDHGPDIWSPAGGWQCRRNGRAWPGQNCMSKGSAVPSFRCLHRVANIGLNHPDVQVLHCGKYDGDSWLPVARLVASTVPAGGPEN